jgi:hypothetical protein
MLGCCVLLGLWNIDVCATKITPCLVRHSTIGIKSGSIATASWKGLAQQCSFGALREARFHGLEIDGDWDRSHGDWVGLPDVFVKNKTMS